MKKIIYLLVFLLSVSISFTSCNILGDDEHCQYETLESKIWTPGTNPALGYFSLSSPPYRPFNVAFIFSRVNHYSSFFKIDNACPYNAIALDIKVKTKPGSIDPSYLFKVVVLKIETVKGKKISKSLSTNIMYKKTDSEFFLNKVIELGGILDNGPAEFAVVCGLTGFESMLNPLFKDVIELENWAEQNILSVEYKTNFIKWN
jgi:hypothetical protein